MRIKLFYYVFTQLLFWIMSSSLAQQNETNALPTNWTEHWHEHRENLTLHHFDEHVAIYFDSYVQSSIVWPLPLLSNAWKYVKETYGSFGPDPHLYVVLHGRKFQGCHSNTFLDAYHDHLNFLDCGLKDANPWVANSTKSIELLLTNFGHIIRKGAYGRLNSADLEISGEQIREILSYDVLLKICGESAEMKWKEQKLKESVENIFWFKDWFLPIYTKYGGVAVLKNFLKLVFHFGTPHKKGYESLNEGEFVHFWSGAAAEDLESLARTAFGSQWNDEAKKMLTYARNNYPDITYPVLETTPISTEAPPVVRVNPDDNQNETFNLVYLTDNVIIYSQNFQNGELSSSDLELIADMWNYAYVSWLANICRNASLFIVLSESEMIGEDGSHCTSLNNYLISQFHHHLISCSILIDKELDISVLDNAKSLAKEIALMTLKLVGGYDDKLWPAREISGWTMTSILVYDIFLNLSLYENAERWKEEQFKLKDSHGAVENVFWFRDWYFPIYELHGGSQVLRKFFSLIQNEIVEGKNGNGAVSKQMNMGEWVHFWSEAANDNLLSLASKAISWTEGFQDEFLNARISYPSFNYSCSSCSIFPRNAASDQDITPTESNKITTGLLVAALILAGLVLGAVVIKYRRKMQNLAQDVGLRYLRRDGTSIDAAGLVEYPTVNF